jgi:transcriptional regulator with XRE-family HTH domain
VGNTREILAKNIKETRQKLGITQAELAEMAGISTNFIAMIELKHKFPAPETLDRLAAAMNLQVPELFGLQAVPEDVIEKFYHAILNDLDQSIERAINKAIDKRYNNNQST